MHENVMKPTITCNLYMLRKKWVAVVIRVLYSSALIYMSIFRPVTSCGSIVYLEVFCVSV